MKAHEINKLIAEKEGLDFRCEFNGGKDKVLLTQSCAEKLKTSFVFNPAEDWKQAGPLIEKYRIQIIPSDDGGWSAKYGWGYIETDGHLLFAAMRAVIACPKDDEWPEPEEDDQCPGCGDQGVTIEGWPCDICGDED